ncbi:15954_t:CDS:1, partial [Funneliformis geosporum]
TIIIPSGNFSHEIFTSLKIITGGNFVPSAIHSNTIVKLEHSCLVDKIKTVLVLCYSTDILFGKLKDIGVSYSFR